MPTLAKKACSDGEGGSLDYRNGVLADANKATRLLLDFHKASKLPFPSSAAWAHSLFCDGVTSDNRLALVCAQPDDGMVGVLLAIVEDSLLGPFRQAQELAWWVHPAHRGSGHVMLQHYEAWARERGARIISGSSLVTMPSAEKLYERAGYERAETHWMKVVE